MCLGTNEKNIVENLLEVLLEDFKPLKVLVLFFELVVARVRLLILIFTCVRSALF